LKTGASVGFRPQKSTLIFDSKNRHDRKNGNDAAAAANYAYMVSNQNKKKVIEMYFHQFCTVFKRAKQKQQTSTNHNSFCRSRASESRPQNRTRSDRSRKSGVENRVVFT